MCLEELLGRQWLWRSMPQHRPLPPPHASQQHRLTEGDAPGRRSLRKVIRIKRYSIVLFGRLAIWGRGDRLHGGIQIN